MKRTVLFAVLAATTIHAYSQQQWTGSTNTSNNIARSGDLSVLDGTASRISLGAAWGGNPIWGWSYMGFNLRRDNNALWSYLGDGGNTNAGMVLYNSGDNVFFSLKPSTGGQGGTITDADVYNNAIMSMRSNGQVAIGHVNGANAMQQPSGFKLYVEGGILTERVRIAPKNGADWKWADFVFDKAYKLMPLETLENYISEKGHLPEIPTSCEVEEHGVDMAVIQAKLLQKVEELTLYVIKQQKEIDELKKGK